MASDVILGIPISWKPIYWKWMFCFNFKVSYLTIVHDVRAENCAKLIPMNPYE